MIVNVNFEKQKLGRLINTKGEETDLYTFGENVFGEPDYDNPILLATVKGIFRRTTTYISETTSEGTVLRKKDTPMFLCLYDDELKLLIKQEDDIVLKVHDTLYKLVKADNVHDLNISYDLSLEEVQNEYKI